MHLLGVRIDDMNKQQAMQQVADFLSLPGQHKIFTPNPEMIVKAQQDQYFKKILNEGDLNLCDGMGVRIFTGIRRVPGVEFMMELCQLAAEQGRQVYLLGSGSDEVVYKVVLKLVKKFPSLKMPGYDKGPGVIGSMESEFFASDPEDIIAKINAIKPEILFVAFGMGKQEKWICENLAKMPSVKIAMGVGGSFDFISGKVKRAPSFLRHLGLEWVYRLWQEPRRFGRIFNATIKFFYLYLKSKI
jgi:N-acetylglucosaminyldiphosphoundecaprenol N-acetyl-beta-D-mannosaminyltransferase